MGENTGNVNASDHAAQHCSREDSRQARQIITERIYPFLGKDPGLLIPAESCSINTSLDLFLYQEQNKKIVPGRREDFQCGYCGKQFRTEFYMDRHMDNKHKDKLNPAQDGSLPCLGHHCGELGCGSYQRDACNYGVIFGGDGSAGCKACDPAEMSRRRFRCKTLFQRCFNPSNDISRGKELGRLRDYFVNEFCNHLGCDDNNRSTRRTDSYLPRIDEADKMGLGKKSFIVFIVLILSVFYALLGIEFKSSSTKNDLRPARRGRARSRRGLLGGIVGAADGMRGVGSRAQRSDKAEVVQRTNSRNGVVRRRAVKVAEAEQKL